MEYAYATLILTESGEELNETNITGVLDAADVDIEESRVKALVAALENVDVGDAIPLTDIEEFDIDGGPPADTPEAMSTGEDASTTEGGGESVDTDVPETDADGEK